MAAFVCTPVQVTGQGLLIKQIFDISKLQLQKFHIVNRNICKTESATLQATYKVAQWWHEPQENMRLDPSLIRSKQFTKQLGKKNAQAIQVTQHLLPNDEITTGLPV